MIEQAQQQQPTYVMPSVAMTEGLLQQQIDTSTTLDEIENTLLGKKLSFNPNTNSVTWGESDPNLRLINDKGVARLCFDLRPRLTKIFQLSIFDDEHIEAITISLGKTVHRAIFEHWDEWEISSVSAASQISGIIVDTVFSTLRKAHYGKYLKSITTSQSMQEVQHYSQTTPQQKKGILASTPIIGNLFKQ